MMIDGVVLAKQKNNYGIAAQDWWGVLTWTFYADTRLRFQWQILAPLGSTPAFLHWRWRCRLRVPHLEHEKMHKITHNKSKCKQ